MKNLLRIDATLRIVFLSDTYEGSVHDKRIADAPPYPLPPGSELLQDLGFLAFSLDHVTCRTPHKKPRGGCLSPAQKAENQVQARRRVRIEHVTSSVKRCRVLKDGIRLFKEDVRDTVAEIGCSLHNFRIRLSMWESIL